MSYSGGASCCRLDTGYITAWLQELVGINSVNPILDPSAPGEREIAEYVGGAMAALGLEVAIHERNPDGPASSAACAIAGGASLMFNAHADTVDVGGMDSPFSGEIRDGRVYGRGAFDMKGRPGRDDGRVKALADAGVLMAARCCCGRRGREYASLGTEDLVTRYRPTRPSSPSRRHWNLPRAQGFAWFEVTTRGRAAHGSRFDLGIDREHADGARARDLAALEQDLRRRAPHRLVGPPSLHAARSRVVGPQHLRGQLPSPDRAAHIPGESRGAVTDEIRELLRRQVACDPRSRPILKCCWCASRSSRRDAAIVRALTEASTAVLGRRPAYVGQTPWMDAALLAAAGAETVVMGATGAGRAREGGVGRPRVRASAWRSAWRRAAVRYC